ncbi:ATPase [Photobacterium sanctipauli]|uniref:ATPase n=1 Tax=Photobacterium sanctipauli TaxID=1342794 RepID=A0A2T3NF11_9GAMM|nr:ATPase [Photobacterium sanctipauli]PSW13134.1 ATPase [Photobacterium sanctipauli]
MKPIRTIVSWSSGKDSTLTLIRLLNDPHYEVVGLYTTYLNDEVPFQATPIEVVRQQAQQAGLPLIEIPLPEVFPANDIYQSLVIEGIKSSKLEVEAVAFGDMFCNGIAEYRRSYIEPAGWQCVFPLIGQASTLLAQEMLDIGIKTLVVTVDTEQLDGKFCGKWFSESFIRNLPDSVDPCGEDGEFHTLVVKAPCFDGELKIHCLDVERKGRFHHQRYELVEDK